MASRRLRRVGLLTGGGDCPGAQRGHPGRRAYRVPARLGGVGDRGRARERAGREFSIVVVAEGAVARHGRQIVREAKEVGREPRWVASASGWPWRSPAIPARRLATS